MERWSHTSQFCTVVRATRLVNGTPRFDGMQTYMYNVSTLRNQKPLNRSTLNLTGMIMTGTSPHAQTFVFFTIKGGAVLHMREFVIIRVYFYPRYFAVCVYLCQSHIWLMRDNWYFSTSCNILRTLFHLPTVKYEMLGLAAKYGLNGVQGNWCDVKECIWNCFVQKVRF